MQNRIIGVIGPKGSGKTYEVCKEIQRLPRSATFDLTHESAYLCAEPYTGEPKAFAEALKAEQFRIAYRPTVFTLDKEKIHCPAFEPIVRCCYLRGDMTLVIDEAHLLCNAYSCPPMLLTANFLGRHRRFSIIYVAQSFSAVTRPLTRNTDEFWFWRNIEPSDLQGIKERCGQQTAERVATCRKLDLTREGEVIQIGECIKWDVWNGLHTNEQIDSIPIRE